MDKKNTVIGVALIAAAIAYMFWMQQSAPPPPPASAPVAATPAATTSGAPTSTAPASGQPAATTASAPAAAPAANAAFAAIHAEAATATVTTLRNSYIEVRFTDSGGAIRDVAFTKRDKNDKLIYPAEIKGSTPFVFNALHADPMLAFVDFPGLDRNSRFERVSQTANEVVYRAVLDGRLEVTRRYTLPPDEGDKTDPYQLHHETTIRNLTDKTAPPMKVAFALGTSAPTNATDDGLQLTSGYSTGSEQHFTKRADLESSGGFFGIGAHDSKPSVVSPGPVAWASVKNKFFTTVLTPGEPGAAVVTRRVKLLTDLPDDNHLAYGITGSAQFDVKALAPNAEAKLTSDLYVGPKEYARLAKSAVFKADQDKVMEFGFFKYFSQILLTLMTWIHGFVAGGWGVAIILTTLTLKIIFVPFTLAASRSAKRMAKLQPELQALREKYKDNPRKQQEATMALFKTNKVNPVGGCLPILITIPFFMGFFSMLQSTAEFRFAPFLWAADLASPDTIWHIPGINFPVNIMPLLMGATMIVQMRLTPTPSVDNAQAKMMQFMPIIFTLFCYTFSCALALYSTVNGLFTIIQQLVINKMKDPEPAPAAAAVGPGGKPIKNVTPKK
ncbi:MAG: membrane protein insertase YidC [Verrucomicrobia bacterium]|nr:membrane protein insertase YidC [Verrucomicrobiota bacterium]